MKKYLVILLAVLFMVPVTNFATPKSIFEDVASGKSVSYQFDLSHDVDRISDFRVNASSTKIQSIGKTTVATFSVDNNTRDGYTVSLTSANGHLHAADKTDGESDIPYSVIIGNKIGQLGLNMELVKSTFTSAEIKNNLFTVIQLKSGSNQETATAVNFQLDVQVDALYTDRMIMAGNFADALTLTYKDE